MGLDFGSDSSRTLAVSCLDGAAMAAAIAYYPRGFEGRYSALLSNRFRHHPLDYVESMTTSVHETIAALSDRQKPAITGIGGTEADGQPDRTRLSARRPGGRSFRTALSTLSNQGSAGRAAVRAR